MRRNLVYLQIRDFVPIPERSLGSARGQSASAAHVLLQRRLDQNHVELLSQRLQVERLQVGLQIHRRRGRLGDQFVLQTNQLAQLRIFLEAIGQPDVPDEVLRPLTGVDEVLAVVIVRIRRLRSLE